MTQVDGAADAVNGQVAATAVAMSFVCCLQRECLEGAILACSRRPGSSACPLHMRFRDATSQITPVRRTTNRSGDSDYRFCGLSTCKLKVLAKDFAAASPHVCARREGREGAARDQSQKCS